MKAKKLKKFNRISRVQLTIRKIVEKVFASERFLLQLRGCFLFRATDHKGRIIKAPPLSSAASNELKTYLPILRLDEGETIHSLRASSSITLSLLCASDGAVANHVGCRSVVTTQYYRQTSTVMNPTKTSALLTGNSRDSDASHEHALPKFGASFGSRNNLEGFLSVGESVLVFVRVTEINNQTNKMLEPSR